MITRVGRLLLPILFWQTWIWISFLIPQSSEAEWSHNGIRQSDGNNRTNSFLQVPHFNPPTVRPPPYTISREKCPPINVRENWVDTLCGDLNTGFVPQNPLGHEFLDGGTYPFDAIKNKTLDFFRKTLPILKETKSLPKVAKYSSAASTSNYHTTLSPPDPHQRHYYRGKRGIATRQKAYVSPLGDPYFTNDMYHYDNSSPFLPMQRRRTREFSTTALQNHQNGKFCENAMNYYHRLCRIYNTMWGKAPHNIQRETSIETRIYNTKYPSTSPKTSKQLHHHSPKSSSSPSSSSNSVDLPPTPCPSSAEYMTPVFARNHEGAWRYVVQIPKEGYFTQTVEVTKCLKSTCFYMDGSCKASPRWQSLLVAELYYPDATFPTSTSSSSSTGSSIIPHNRKRSTDPSQCDGFDKIGCYQVRLFYDWFLIPGSCKCWKNQFEFTKRPNNFV